MYNYIKTKMIDIVIPQNNEKQFVDLAKKLGYKKIYFLYTFSNYPLKKVVYEGLETENLLLAKPEEILKCKKKSKLIIVESSEKNRFVIEHTKANILFNLELQHKKDHTHYVRSGLDQVTSKLMAKTNKYLAFNFNIVLNNHGHARSRILSRMSQNVKLCRKFNIKTIIASFARSPLEMRSMKDLLSFGITLGMHPKESKKSLNW